MIERFLLPFENGSLDLDDKSVLVLGAEPSPALDELTDPLCVQPFKPIADALISQGRTHAVSPAGSFDLTFVVTNRHRDLTRLRLAQAWEHTRPGGAIIVSGNKTDGIDAHLRELRSAISVTEVLPKSHGKVFWFERTGHEPDIFAGWRGLGKATLNDEGYFTAAGMFSAGAIDKGSKLLAQHLPANAGGRIADLGAGWGYLSAQLLARTEDVYLCELFEADWFALQAAKLNLQSDKARFHWADVSTLPGNDKMFDLVISNPPFHQARKSEPELGMSFILTAARILRPKGRLLLVANRQLPYEKTLSHTFKKVETIEEREGFKVISAAIPKAQRP